MAQKTNITFQQKQALIVQQALLGVISENVRLVTLNTEDLKVNVTCILENTNQDDTEELEDLVSEIEALQDSPTDVNVNVIIDKEPIYLSKLKDLPIYMRRE